MDPPSQNQAGPAQDPPTPVDEDLEGGKKRKGRKEIEESTGRKERKELHSLRRLTIWSHDTGDQHWGGAADNKAIHPMLRSHEN